MQPKIVFADLDATFLALDKSIPKRNWQMLNTLAEQGIDFVPCTGRSFSAIPRELLEHKSVRYAISATGALISSADGTAELASWPVGHERAQVLYEQVKHLPVSFDVFADGKILVERARFELIDGMNIDEAQTQLMLKSRTVCEGLTVPEIIAQATRIDRVGVFCAASPQGEAAKEEVKAKAESSGSLRVILGHPQGLEIVDKSVSKGAALVWLCDYLKIPVRSALAFGDSRNDSDMLIRAGRGVAMKNADPEVKELADEVSELDCGHGGVGAYVEALL